jgi:predicted nucleotidyltransferase
MALTDEAVEKEISRVFAANHKALKGHRVLLFGSRATGTAGARSDFDLAVDGSKPLDLETFFGIKDALDQIPTLYAIDWMDLNRVSQKVSNNARLNGRILYEG